jgi:hypothetical protein
VNAYYWRLSGEAPNSLCKFLGVEEEELKTILQLCKVYNVDSIDNFSRNNFEIDVDDDVQAPCRLGAIPSLFEA